MASGAAGFAILAAIASLMVTGTLGHPVRYDQRQEGDLNIRTDVEDVVLVVVPPKDFIGSRIDLIAASLFKKNSDSFRPERWHYRPYSKWTHSTSSKAPFKIDLGKAEAHKKKVVHHGDPNRYNIRDDLPTSLASTVESLDQATAVDDDKTSTSSTTMTPVSVPSEKTSSEATSNTENKTVKKDLTKEEVKEKVLMDKKSEEAKPAVNKYTETKFPEKVAIPDTDFTEHGSKNSGTKIADSKNEGTNIAATKFTDGKVADGKFPDKKIPEIKVPETKISGPKFSETKFTDSKLASTKFTDSVGEKEGTEISGEKLTESKVSGTKFAEVKVPDVHVEGTKFADTRTPDVHMSGIKLPDVTQSLSKVPNVQVPGTKFADFKVPDIKVTETKFSDLRVPDIQVPVTKFSDAKVQDVKLVGTKVGDAKIPDVKIPEKQTTEADDVPRVLGELSPGSLGPTSIFSREGCGPDAYRDIRGICIYKNPASN